MKISDFKIHLSNVTKVTFLLPNRSKVPEHFHVTELGIITKNYIDCGGTIRNEEVANFQLWTAEDFEHRIHPQKIIDIINIAEEKLGLKDLEIEVEYQSETIGKYGLQFSEGEFYLIPSQTDCLAKDKCGIPDEKISITDSAPSCSADSGCC